MLDYQFDLTTNKVTFSFAFMNVPVLNFIIYVQGKSKFPNFFKVFKIIIFILLLAFSMKTAFKGALDNVLKFYFWLNFIYHVKIDCLIYNYKKKNSKIPSQSREIIIFLWRMHKVGMRLIWCHVVVWNMVILNQNDVIYIMFS